MTTVRVDLVSAPREERRSRREERRRAIGGFLFIGAIAALLMAQPAPTIVPVDNPVKPVVPPPTGTVTTTITPPTDTTPVTNTTTTPPPPGVLRVATGEIQFGNLPVGGQSRVQTVAIENAGEGDLRIARLSVDNELFSVDEVCAGKTLPPHDSCDARVRFNAATRGEVKARLTVTDGGGNRASVTLTGRGTVHDFRADQKFVELGPTHNELGPPKVVTFTNDGDDEVTIGKMIVSGDGFRIAGDLCSEQTLSPGQSCKVVVQALGRAREGKLVAPASGGDVGVLLQATTPEPPPRPKMIVEPPALDFTGSSGAAAMLSSVSRRQVTVRNAGPGPLTISKISFENETKRFVIMADQCTGKTLAENTACTLIVVFRAGEQAPANRLRIESNAVPDPTFNPVGPGTTAVPFPPKKR